MIVAKTDKKGYKDPSKSQKVLEPVASQLLVAPWNNIITNTLPIEPKLEKDT